MRGRRTTGAVLTHSVLIQAVTFLLRPASTYQALDLDAPAWALGAIGATFAIVPLCLAIPLGVMSDRLGERRLVVAGSLVTVGAALTFLLGAESIAGLVVANALLGAGHLGCVLGQQAAVANSASGRGLDTLFGYYTFAASLGQAAGPALGAIIGGSQVRPDTGLVFGVATGLAILLVPVALLVAPPRTTMTKQASAGGTGRLLRTPGLPQALVTSSIILSAVDLTIVYLPALGAERGYSAGVVGALLTVRAVFSMVSRVLLGWLTSHLGRSRVMTSSIVLSALSLGACALPLPWWGLLIAIAVAGLGLGVGQPITMSWLSERAPAGLRARALSMRLMGNRAGQVAIPSVLGVVAASAGPAGAIAATAVAVGATTLLVRGADLDER
ncbi:MAG: MFS transporter [Aeromicrobium sp.]